MKQTIAGMITLVSFVVGACAIESNLIVAAVAGIAAVVSAVKGELWEVKA